MSDQNFSIAIIDENDVEEIAPLFDAYRVFYGKPSELSAVSQYLLKRLSNNDVISFLAKAKDGTPAGFTNIYPTFSSVSMGINWVLNDLFVLPDFRRYGLAQKLMNAAQEQAAQNDVKFMSLITNNDNEAAQALYNGQGWENIPYKIYTKQIGD